MLRTKEGEGAANAGSLIPEGCFAGDTITNMLGLRKSPYWSNHEKTSILVIVMRAWGLISL